ncbi:MAG: hypothetical protein PHO27_04435 [Sulfuricurvum sp.]|nr:hypothetical protein [Sulfuricurvum sp.]
MLDTLREANKQFQEVHNLLISSVNRDSNYFTQLSVATEEAYVLMNEGMCANNSVCHQCAEHRDYIRSMLDVLGNLEAGAPLSSDYETKLSLYSTKVNDILSRIAHTLTTL